MNEGQEKTISTYLANKALQMVVGGLPSKVSNTILKQFDRLIQNPDEIKGPAGRPVPPVTEAEEPAPAPKGGTSGESEVPELPPTE